MAIRVGHFTREFDAHDATNESLESRIGTCRGGQGREGRGPRTDESRCQRRAPD